MYVYHPPRCSILRGTMLMPKNSKSRLDCSAQGDECYRPKGRCWKDASSSPENAPVVVMGIVLVSEKIRALQIDRGFGNISSTLHSVNYLCRTMCELLSPLDYSRDTCVCYDFHPGARLARRSLGSNGCSGVDSYFDRRGS